MPEQEDMSKYLEAFSAEAEEHLQNINDNLLELEKNPESQEIIDQLFRSSHTLKSSSAAMGFMKISELAHSMEDVLGRLKNKELTANTDIIDLLLKSFDALETMVNQVVSGEKENVNTPILISKLKRVLEMPAMKTEDIEDVEELGKEGKLKNIEGEESKGLSATETLKTVKFIKVGVERLDKLMNLVGELLISKMKLEQIKTTYKVKGLDESVDELDRLISDVQHEVMQSRLIPIGQIFNRFPRMIRDLSEKENKKINLIMKGEEIELDRSIIDKIGEPLVHLLRNSIDHGIEESKDGEIRLIAKKERNAVIIEVEDNGQGFDIEKIKKVALEKGVVNEKQLAGMSDKKIMMIPFHPNFSTAKKVTEVSGRGVGLDVVKTKIEEMNGNVKVESEKGKGTKIILELPLTLAIIQCFLIKIGKEVYGIPLNNVVRTVRINEEDIKTIENHETFILDEEDIPLLRLQNLLKLEYKRGETVVVVIVEKGEDKAGLTVDKIIGQQELIIKPLEKSIKKTKGFSGSTILGDGSVVLIIDVNTLI